jgi:hypothetical protein
VALRPILSDGLPFSWLTFVFTVFPPKKKPIFPKENRLYLIRITLGKHRFFGSPAILPYCLLTWKGPVALCPLVAQGLPFRKLHLYYFKDHLKHSGLTSTIKESASRICDLGHTDDLTVIQIREEK